MCETKTSLEQRNHNQHMRFHQHVITSPSAVKTNISYPQPHNIAALPSRLRAADLHFDADSLDHWRESLSEYHGTANCDWTAGASRVVNITRTLEIQCQARRERTAYACT